MFNKTKAPNPERPNSPTPIPPLPDLPSPPGQKTATATQPVSPVGGRGVSTLSAELQFDGNVSGQGDLQVDGAVKGDVKVGRLIVGETGAIEGGVAADYVEVRGRIVGAVTGKQVKLVSTAYVDGDITAEQLSIDIGAYFQGRVLQARRDVAPTPAPKPVPAPAATPAPAPAEPKPVVADLKPAN